MPAQGRTRDQLIEAGYFQGMAPSKDAYEADEKACQESRCPKCNTLGLLYEPYMRAGRLPGDCRYAALARCPLCRFCEEF